MNIGFLGLGKLGLPVSLAVEDKGHKVFGYDISEQTISDIKNKKIISNSKTKKAIKKAKKLIKNQGRLLVRKSGTEPKIRVMGESNNKKLLQKCIQIVKQSLK